MAEGFLGRWSQRKHAVREGKPPPDPNFDSGSAPTAPTATTATTVTTAAPVTPQQGFAPDDANRQQRTADERPSASSSLATEAPQAAPPSMQDVAALHAESDFRPFVARAVAPEVRNAAMKKLFADPHFNVMDGLDIYIDDYSIPDPLPASMLRKMVSAQFLKLLDDEAEPPGAVRAADTLDGDALVVAQAEPFESPTPKPVDTDCADSASSHTGSSETDTTASDRTQAAVTDIDKTDPPV